jgi:enoyl-CoA hydratase/carnithine racemase
MVDVVTLEYKQNERGYIAIITLNNEKKLNVHKTMDRRST